MPLVTVMPKYQVTIPASVRKQTGLGVGDLLDAKVERGRITLTLKSLIDRELALALDDVRKGRTYGPFDSVDALMRSLRQESKKRKRVKNASKR